MKVGRVIGRVVLSHTLPSLEGARWLIVSPCSRAALEKPQDILLTAEPSPVVYDKIGASTGDLVGYTEGGEATRPFPAPTPVDAYNAAILDHVSISPSK